MWGALHSTVPGCSWREVGSASGLGKGKSTDVGSLGSSGCVCGLGGGVGGGLWGRRGMGEGDTLDKVHHR